MRKDLTNRIPSLDGWRAIAILIVVLGHITGWTGAWFQPFQMTGHHGVAIFYVISGFLITSLLLRQIDQNGRIDPRDFYVRRIFRIWPCQWAYLLIVAAFGLVNRSEVMSCLLFFRNFLTEDLRADLFTQHFWSLAVEEQFYLTWPLLLMLTGRRRAPWIAALMVLCAAPSSASIHVWPYAALLIGCATAFVRLRKVPFHGLWFAFGMVGLFVAITTHRQRPIPLWECALVAFLIWSTAGPGVTFAQKALSFRPLAFIGTISYSLYVWQQIIGLANLGHTGWVVALKLALLFSAATLSYYAIERPMIRFGHRITSAPLQPELVQVEESAS